jgi:hypothetical protein
MNSNPSNLRQNFHSGIGYSIVKGDMMVDSSDDPLFEREYSTLSQAQIGHNETVELLSTGKLTLSHVRRT